MSSLLPHPQDYNMSSAAPLSTVGEEKLKTERISDGDSTCVRFEGVMDESFEGWELMAMWDDAKFGLQHRNDLGKVAVVGGPTWVKWGAKVGKLLVGCEVRTGPEGGT